MVPTTPRTKSSHCSCHVGGLSKCVAALGLVFCLAIPSACSGSEATPPTTIRIGVLPIVDALPAYIADANGWFDSHLVNVEMVSFASASARDAAMQTGQLDLEFNDPISTALLNKNNVLVQVVRSTMHTDASRPTFEILGSPLGSATTMADLKGRKIAISPNTIVDWATDQLVAGSGLGQSDVAREIVPDIGLRMSMLAQGQVDAATLPEPFATKARAEGARLIYSDVGLIWGPPQP